MTDSAAEPMPESAFPAKEGEATVAMDDDDPRWAKVSAAAHHPDGSERIYPYGDC